MTNPKPKMEEFGTLIMQSNAIEWQQVYALNNFPCEPW
jgi:hypothetical protein